MCSESQNTFYGPWIESFQDSWWDPEFPQLSQMVQPLPGFLHLGLNVCSPSQVLGEVYTEVLEATHPLHRGPTDHKRSVGLLLSLPEVHDQLLSFAHVQREHSWCGGILLHQSSRWPEVVHHSNSTAPEITQERRVMAASCRSPYGKAPLGGERHCSTRSI